MKIRMEFHSPKSTAPKHADFYSAFAVRSAYGDKINITTISKQLKRVLDELEIIIDENAEMKTREGSDHGDN